MVRDTLQPCTAAIDRRDWWAQESESFRVTNRSSHLSLPCILWMVFGLASCRSRGGHGICMSGCCRSCRWQAFCAHGCRQTNLDGRTAARMAIAEAHAAGARIGAFIAEPLLSCGGQVVLPDGYLAEVYEEMRAEGAACIADEIQTGFGRVGRTFWAFQVQHTSSSVCCRDRLLVCQHRIRQKCFQGYRMLKLCVAGSVQPLMPV